LRRIYLEPFEVDELIRSRFNPIAELFDFDCHFDFTNSPFDQPSFGCYNTVELNREFWRQWIENRKNAVTSYSEYILKEKPVTEFEGLYLQTLEICLEDINNTIRRTQEVQDVKLEKRQRRRDILGSILAKRERRKKIIEKISKISKVTPDSYQMDDEITKDACPLPTPIPGQPGGGASSTLMDSNALVVSIRDQFVNAVNSRTLRGLGALTPDVVLTLTYGQTSNYLSVQNDIYSAFENFHDQNFRLNYQTGNVQWIVLNETNLQINFDGNIESAINGAEIGRFRTQFILRRSQSGQWGIFSGEFAVFY